MNKKFLIGLFLISLIALAGGCGSSSSSNRSVNKTTDVNAVLSGTWASVNNGTATITNNNDDSDELENFIDAFGEIPNELLEQYKQEQSNETLNATVTRAMLFFDDCDVANNNGTAKFTAIVIISNDSLLIPVCLNGVGLSTQRNSTNEWTLTTSDGSSLLINMTSEEKINLSGKVQYLGYDCEFSTVIEKNPSKSLNPKTILNGTWSLDGTYCGGYLANSSDVKTVVIPEAVSILFNATEQVANEQENKAFKSNITSFYSLQMKSSSFENDNSSTLLQNINPPSEGSLTQLYDDVYKFTETNGNENIIVLENTNEIFMFRLENSNDHAKTCIFLPLKKASFDIESALNKTWRASKGNGGGYLHFILDNDFDLNDEFEAALAKALENYSFTLENASLNFSDVTLSNDNIITVKVNIDTTFHVSNKFLDILGKTEEIVPISDHTKYTFNKSGNFLQFVNDTDNYSFSFFSDNELFMSIKMGQEGEGEGEFVVRFTAN